MALLQCTCPLTRPGDLGRALRLLRAGYDSVFAVVRRKPGLRWIETDAGARGVGRGRSREGEIEP